MTSDRDRWAAVDSYLASTVLPSDPVLDAALADARAAGLPPIEVPPSLGMLLHLLARSIGARRILEVGTLAGYSTIWLARALPPGGTIVTFEIDPRHAAVAGANLARAGLDERAEIRVGPAAAGLARLVEAHGEPFDLAFIDADKQSNTDYLAASLSLLRPGGLVVVDNVVRGGTVADAASVDADVIGSRRVLEAMGAEPRLATTVLQTVGARGHDGVAVGLVLA